MYGSLARKPERCKVVVRNLPPALTQEDFMDALSQFSERYDWTSFVPGKVRWVFFPVRAGSVRRHPDPLLSYARRS